MKKLKMIIKTWVMNHLHNINNDYTFTECMHVCLCATMILPKKEKKSFIILWILSN